MRVLLDLNVSPSLCQQFEAAGHEAVHWSTIGELTASDDIIMRYARQNGLVLITHDLDFGALLAATRAKGPSVVQLRAQDALADTFVKLISATLTRFEAELSAGALIVVDETRSRVRILPIT